MAGTRASAEAVPPGVDTQKQRIRAETERLVAQLLMQRAASLAARSEEGGVLAFCGRGVVRERVNERFLHNTLRGVFHSNKRSQETELWQLRAQQREREEREDAQQPRGMERQQQRGHRGGEGEPGVSPVLPERRLDHRSQPVSGQVGSGSSSPPHLHADAELPSRPTSESGSAAEDTEDRRQRPALPMCHLQSLGSNGSQPNSGWHQCQSAAARNQELQQGEPFQRQGQCEGREIKHPAHSLENPLPEYPHAGGHDDRGEGRPDSKRKRKHKRSSKHKHTSRERPGQEEAVRGRHPSSSSAPQASPSRSPLPTCSSLSPSSQRRRPTPSTSAGSPQPQPVLLSPGSSPATLPASACPASVAVGEAVQGVSTSPHRWQQEPDQRTAHAQGRQGQSGASAEAVEPRHQGSRMSRRQQQLQEEQQEEQEGQQGPAAGVESPEDEEGWMMGEEELQALLSRQWVKGRGGVGSRLEQTGPYLPSGMTSAASALEGVVRGPLRPPQLAALPPSLALAQGHSGVAPALYRGLLAPEQPDLSQQEQQQHKELYKLMRKVAKAKVKEEERLLRRQRKAQRRQAAAAQADLGSVRARVADGGPGGAGVRGHSSLDGSDDGSDVAPAQNERKRRKEKHKSKKAKKQKDNGRD